MIKSNQQKDRPNRAAPTGEQISVGIHLKSRFSLSEKGPRFLLALSFLFFAVATSSELWVTSEGSFFSRSWLFTGAIFPVTVAVLLIVLHAHDWKRLSGGTTLLDAAAYGLLSALGDILMMMLVVLIVYIGVGEVLLLELGQYWEVFYLAPALAVGEFALSSAVSSMLKRARKLEEDVKEVGAELRKAAERIEQMKPIQLPESVSKPSKILQEYIKDTASQGDDIDGGGEGKGTSEAA